ncbi:dihydrofolate reductase family protein [Cellulomonas wangsupingiae]|uniref:dihydrofolate reductase family protein n=1 Tax=Cellulomonas wangsupingiae TaxID=2968085 RepID=UPI001D0F31F0|nr:dihydrofolate reductase family protein [Cellulomonas wangsupingiae]MCM0640456.1 dihydrofolate reductase family protein [Cellulomonas wangsupingiae]
MPTDAPPLDLLLPGVPRTFRPLPGEPDLVALLGRGRPARHVTATMVASVDGAACGPDGRSGSLGTPADRRVFAVLRALADVVLVGAGTVRAEGYRELPVVDHLRGARAAAGRAPALVLAIVTRRGHVPREVLHGALDVVVVTGAAGAERARAQLPADRVVAVPRDDDPGSPDLAAALDVLAARGLGHVLAEGGPRLLANLLAADLVDELCLTTSPLLLAGAAPRAAAGAGPLDPPRPARLRHLLRAPDDTLLTCWDLRPPVGSGA